MQIPHGRVECNDYEISPNADKVALIARVRAGHIKAAKSSVANTQNFSEPSGSQASEG